jgi:2-iminobutanoate/2-iminopropanoate deaminase
VNDQAHSRLQPFSAADGAPPVGPYSPAVAAGGFLFVSGQVPLAQDGSVAGESAAEQARTSLANMGALLGAAGRSYEHVVKTTIFLTDMADFAAVNEVYAEFFSPPFPARSTVAVAALPKGVKVEIEAVALAG